ncbi:hypothetical protein, partial [Staphylococcus aureus]|uniref:hypothetical protein n=1 Tax=Staphylococcus aureus TaxID=1280 RepID=UPI0039BDAE83
MTMAQVERRLLTNAPLKADLALADVAGGNTNDLLRAASNVPSPARQSLVQQLEYRQANQLKRLQKDIGDAFGNPQD